MRVSLAIHHRSGSFSDRWIEYCTERGIPHEVVNCYDSDVLGRLRSAKGLLWHWSHTIWQDVLLARHLIRSAEMMGLKVFPSTHTCWHFDDKVAQKYLLEAVAAPLAPTHVFYDLDRALEWIAGASFPKVFKLRKGAGSVNVRLIRTADEARKFARKAFGGGFKPVSPYLQEASLKFAKAQRRRDLVGTLRRLPRTLTNIYRMNAKMGRENGYVYFQDFVPGNLFDTRVTVIGNRAFAFTRNVRKDDFRASGSGSIDYDLKRVNPNCVRAAFEVARKVKAQSVAFDFVLDSSHQPWITEISYGYLAKPVYDCAGHWDEDLGWHEGHVWPQDAILTDLLRECEAG